MSYSIPTHQNPNDTFFLARYAHNVLAPLFETARQYEPSLRYQFHLNFDIARSYSDAGSYLDILVHWDRDGMFLTAYNRTTEADVDKVAAEVQKFIDTEQAARLPISA